jgi:tripartite-type tricarboxylate transporter receptor subunit TctC
MHHLASLATIGPIAVVLIASAAAQSENWPSKPVRIVVPLAPGGTSDTLGRTMAQQLETRLNGKFYIENRPGAGGVIGATYVAEQAPDGYTLGISGIGSHVIAPAIKANVGFDPMKSFTHIAFLGGAPTALVAHPSLGVATVNELIERARRDKLTYASSGAGTHGHLIGEFFARKAGIGFGHIPYRGASAGLQDLIAGHVPFALITLSTAAPQIRAGTVKAIAITSAARLAQFPDVPTFAEAGYPDLVALTWFALSGPADLPRPLVIKLNEAAVQAMTSPAVAKQLESETIQTQKMNADEFTAFVQTEINRWAPIARSTGVKPQ